MEDSLDVPGEPRPVSKERIKNMKKLNIYISKIKRLEAEKMNLLRRKNMENEKNSKKGEINEDLKHAIMA